MIDNKEQELRDQIKEEWDLAFSEFKTKAKSLYERYKSASDGKTVMHLRTPSDRCVALDFELKFEKEMNWEIYEDENSIEDFDSKLLKKKFPDTISQTV